MKLLRLIVISGIILFIVVTFLFALFPSTIRVSRIMVVNADLQKTSATIEDLKTWRQWNHFINDSLLTNINISSPSMGKSAFLQSDQFKILVTGNNLDSMSTLWTKTGGKSFTGQFTMTSEAPGITTVQWYFDFHFKWYPWEKLGAMFYDKQLGPVMEKSLNDLNTYIGKIP